MKPHLSQRIQFSLAYVLVAALVLSLLQSWLLAPRTVELPYSKFLELLRADKIEKVAVTEREIRGLAKTGALPPPPSGAGDRLRQALGSDDDVRVFTVTRIPGVEELNIGHCIVSRAVLVGMERAVREMKEAIRLAQVSPV